MGMGPATYAEDADVANAARDALDHAAELVETLACAQRRALESLIALWPTSAWLASGSHAPATWLAAHTSVSPVEARRLVRVAGVCADHASLADAVVTGALSLGRADTLARAVTSERAPFLAASLSALLALGTTTPEDDDFAAAVRYWVDRVDEHRAPRHGPDHRLYLTQRLFGGGEIQGELTPASFATVAAALDAFTQDPDPADAPHRRTPAERRADALDDLATFGLSHDCDDDGVCDTEGLDAREEDTFDDTTSRDALDEQLDGAEGGDDVDPLLAVRRRLRHAMRQRRRRMRRRTKARSGVTTNLHLDLQTLARDRRLDDPDLFDGLVLRGEHWPIAEASARRLLCDSALVATIFAGNRILDANASAEQFSPRQRRALAARDRHCVFPGCRRPPRHCDAHHIDHRVRGGPTVVANGCLLCRFHHRLIHEHGWTLRHDDDGTWNATDPHGTVWAARKPRPASCAGAD